jgi:hypothetical protein
LFPALLEMLRMTIFGLWRGFNGPNIDSVRRSLWEELVGLISWCDLPWCIGGDFNVTRFPCEKLGEARLCPAMMEFRDFMLEHNFMDLPLTRRPFSWSNNFSWSRIDRFLVSWFVSEERS